MNTNSKNDETDFVFEASWEVCNKVGGIYTVLSTKAKTMVSEYQDQVIFIGPDIWSQSNKSPWFIEDKELLSEWIATATTKENKISIRAGRWDIPGKPMVLLIGFQSLFEQKNELYTHFWDKFQVDSLHAYGDYDEACMFACAAAKTIESYYTFHKKEKINIIAHFNEWMMGMGLLYLKDRVPQITTVFTTHATTLGRSIAGNNKPLYNHLQEYDPDSMARELNIESKHSIEKTAAAQADCFTTVSNITAKESLALLKCEAKVTPNGFEKDFIPKGKKYETKRIEARNLLINVAEKLFGYQIQEDSLLIATSGRYEYRNKGIDVFIDSLGRLNKIEKLNKDIIAFIMVPAWIENNRADLEIRLKKQTVNPRSNGFLPCPNITHWIHNMNQDPILNQLNYLNLHNTKQDKVKVIFVPSYLNGNDGIFNKTYYDLLIGMDTTVFASYYEPWGYTPHESLAFSVPTITTSLTGCGLWIQKTENTNTIESGISVIHRDDYNFVEVSESICNTLFKMSFKDEKQKKEIRKKAGLISDTICWDTFFPYYKAAYQSAKACKDKRTNK